jgi:hypothetical protein
MRWIMLADRPSEDLNFDPVSEWAIHPQFYRVEESDKDDRLLWTVSLMHKCSGTTNTPPGVFRCGLQNREDAMRKDAFPEYACDKCGKKSPKNIVEQKIDRQTSLKGIDPRNNRRGAVLATREKATS